MDFLKVLFNDDALTYDEFMTAINANNIKLADLSKGEYVAKKKYDDDLKAKDSAIAKLNEDITTRDTDLGDLKTKLADAGTNADKLNQLTNDLSALQGKYDNEVKTYKAQLKKQAYEFAVKEFAATKHFTSNAAKRDFINSMISADLKMGDSGIMGGDDFVKQYTTNNADAFVVEEEPEETPKPMFVESLRTPDYVDNGNLFNFNFTGVRKHED